MPENPLDLGSLTRAALRNLHYFWIAFLTCGIAALFYYVFCFAVHPSFNSRSLLLVNTSVEASYTFDGGSRAAMISQLAENADTYVHLLKSETLLQRTVDTLELPVTPQGMQEKLQVHTVAGTPFIQLDVRWGDPQTAYDIAQSLIGNFPGVMADSGLDGALVVIDQPTFADNPDMLSAPILLALTLCGGLALGFLAVVLDELIYSGFRTEEDVSRHLGIQTLAVWGREAFGRVFRSPQGDERRKAAARELYFNLMRQTDGTGGRVLMTSAFENEGRLPASFALARAAMDNGEKTLFIGVGVNKSQFARLQPGIQAFCRDADTDENGKPQSNVIVLPLLKNGQVDMVSLQKVLEREKAKYTFIVVDFPALEYHRELRQAQGWMEHAVMVLAHNQTTVKTAKRQQDFLRRCGFTLWGAVFTQVSQAGLCSYYHMLRPNQ